VRKVVFVSGGLLLLGVLAVLTFGLVRYSGPSGLLLRVRAEFAAAQPRPEFVPTPLVASGTDDKGAQAVIALITQQAAAPTASPLPSRESATPAAAVGELVPPRATPEAPSCGASVTKEPTPAPAPADTPPPVAPVPLLPSRVELTGLTHTWQTWNNCGPATLSMYLSFWDCALTQEQIRLTVRPNPEDKHAGPEELATVARAQGLKAAVRVDGTPDMLRGLLAAGVPVMVSTWHEDDPGDGMGHYRLLVGYDDAAQHWLLYDSLAATAADPGAPYQPLVMPYAEFEPLWEVFNRRYVLAYRSEFGDAVAAVVGEDLDDRSMWEGARDRALAEIQADEANPFAWFNAGSSLLALGEFEPAAAAYDRARQLGLPWRMLWYQFGPFAAYYEVGRYDEVIALADATLKHAQDIEELHYWRGRALAAQGDTQGAREAYERALAQKPDYADALEALAALEGQG